MKFNQLIADIEMEGKMNGTVGSVLKSHRAFLIDNFGVLRRGNGPIPGVGKSIENIRFHGNRPILLSNTANFRPIKLQEDLAKQGIELALEDIITSGMALGPYFREHQLAGKPTLVVGNDVTNEYVQAAGGTLMQIEGCMEHFREVEVLVVGWYPVVPQDSKDRFGLISLEVLQAAVNVMKFNSHARGVVANPDVTAPRDETSILFACGALGNLIAQCSRRVLDQLGKPYQAIYDLAFAKLPGIPLEEIVMVGDSLEYDILGARNAGIKSLLTLSGNTTLDDLRRSNIKPDFLAETFTPDSPLLDIP